MQCPGTPDESRRRRQLPEHSSSIHPAFIPSIQQSITMGGGSEYVIAGRKVSRSLYPRSDLTGYILLVRNFQRKSINDLQLSMATLGVFFGGIVFATSGGSKEQPQALASKIPAITADSSDEENFIKQFLKEAEDAEKKH
ncbi:hypothetical protein G7K_0352-t1 [Saitoella complicata NRRL Y-17804]|uniref:Uncharacterized protein n=1 Tax=Saitoella complicata (strain BCRC 22490 / CBS 7301 / JCM 7358 / NBRC 10748 / NRRL Y-17804) TaxID=698492 RepID=A0A0E9N874_SAICN|nr:hypothetical protein G7K_0352-t1 [Saitoella complicata NRRL Y-17804]